MSTRPKWTDAAWPAGLIVLLLLRLKPQGNSMLYLGALVLNAIWLVGAVANIISRGGLARRFGFGDELRIPQDFHRFCEENPVTPSLRLLLTHLLNGGGPHDEAIRDVDSSPTIASEADALAVCAAFNQCHSRDGRCHVVRLFKECGSAEAYRIFHELAMPSLHQHFVSLDRERRSGDTDPDMLAPACTLIAYGYEPSYAFIASLTRDASVAESPWWELVFRSINTEDPVSRRLITDLTRNLPTGNASVAFLDWANHAMLANKLACHPFDQPAGINRLRGYLTDVSPERSDHAISAAVALALVPVPAELAALAESHPDHRVRVECAWARAKSGDSQGVDTLVAGCADWKTREMAASYLAELGNGSRIPADAVRPREAAIGKMARWLEHPNELGELPESLEIIDHRVIHWPTADRRIPVTLLRWKLRDREGIGMTGSCTWCFFFGTKPGDSVLDIYARHCNWELEQEKHHLAPEDNTDLEHGRSLLVRLNPAEIWEATG